MSDRLNELEEILEALEDDATTISFSSLCLLSDLSSRKLVQFRKAWTSISAPRRRWLVKALVESAEVNFEVTFDAIFQFCLGDEDELVRATAVDGLWECERVALTGRFLSMLRSDPAPEVRAAAAQGLGRFVLAGELEKLDDTIHSRIITELLTTFHVEGESVDVRRRAVESVAYSGHSGVRDVLEAAYFDDDERMRLSAVTGMGRSCDRRWESAVLQELASPSPAMLYEAALACGGLDLQNAVPALANLARHPDRQLSDSAIWALGQISGDGSRVALEAAYDGADEDMISAIDDALAEHALSGGDLGFPLYDLQLAAEEELAEEDLFPNWPTEDGLPSDASGVGWDDEEL